MQVTLHKIRVRFGSLVAVDGVSLEIAAGAILAIVGENGAGKSTLMNVLFGLVTPESGQVEIDGRPRRWSSPQDAIQAGLGMVHQHFMLQEDMSVLENILLCHEPLMVFGFLDFKTARRKLMEGFRQHGIAIDLDTKVGDLTVGQKQVVEILKMLYRDASVLILDEPTAVLTPHEKDRLFKILRSFAAARKAIVIITHKLDEVMEIADRVAVMRGGRLISSRPLAETSKEQIAREIVGGELPPPLRPAARQPGASVLSVEGVRVTGPGQPAGPLDFDLRQGEILGIAGVSGNGQAALIQAITGLRPVAAGKIELAGRPLEGLDIRARRLAGLSYIPEDRQRVGLALGASLVENANAGHDNVKSFAQGPFLNRQAMVRFAQDLIDRYHIKVSDPDKKVSTLSGGNKQKLVVGRELSRQTPLVVAENPTWGVDIGTSELIHRELVRMRDNGHAVLLVSTDLDEILCLSDRILVIYSGLLSPPILAAEADRYKLGQLMTSRSYEVRQET